MLGEMKDSLMVATLKIAVFMCVTMSMMLLVDKVYMLMVVSFVKLFGREPQKWEALNDDAELGNTNYPMVLVQIPMCNEKQASTSISSLIHFYQHMQIKSIIDTCRYISSPSELHAPFHGPPIGL